MKKNSIRIQCLVDNDVKLVFGGCQCFDEDGDLIRETDMTVTPRYRNEPLSCLKQDLIQACRKYCCKDSAQFRVDGKYFDC